MHRRRRALRILMWTGGLLSLLIAVALVFSFQYRVCHQWSLSKPAIGRPSGPQRYCLVSVSYGSFCLCTHDIPPSNFPDSGWSSNGSAWPVVREAIWPKHAIFNDPDIFILTLPLWLPLALVLLPTLASAFLLRRHARRPGHCPACGYDLAGNRSGRCPECGTDVKLV